MATTTERIYMKVRALMLFIAVLCLTGCFSRSAAMTSESYSMVQVGASVDSLSAEVGKPYAIHIKEGGIKEYEYVERIRNGRNLVVENHYFLLVQDGKVVG